MRVKTPDSARIQRKHNHLMLPTDQIATNHFDTNLPAFLHALLAASLVRTYLNIFWLLETMWISRWILERTCSSSEPRSRIRETASCEFGVYPGPRLHDPFDVTSHKVDILHIALEQSVSKSGDDTRGLIFCLRWPKIGGQIYLLTTGVTPATDASWGAWRSKLWRSHIPIACYARSKGQTLRSSVRFCTARTFRRPLDA